MKREKVDCPYSAEEIEKIDNGKGYWSYIKIGVFETLNGVKNKIGEYKRSYPNMFSTFFPFFQDGKWYALYSEDYTATSVMELPSCKKIAGEEPHAHGFCPTTFYVPYNDTRLLNSDPKTAETIGFVSGCVWGDDSSWKIQFLDLSDIKNGNIKRDARFGYIELPNNLELKDTIDFSDWYYDPDDDPDGDWEKRLSINIRTLYGLDGTKHTTSDKEYELQKEIEDLRTKLYELNTKLGNPITYKDILYKEDLESIKIPSINHEMFIQQVIDQMRTKYDRKEINKLLHINYDLQYSLLAIFCKDNWQITDKKIPDLISVIMGKKSVDKIEGTFSSEQVNGQTKFYIEVSKLLGKNKVYELVLLGRREGYTFSDIKNGDKIEASGFINKDNTFYTYWTNKII